MLILLSPAKTLDFGTSVPNIETSVPRFIPEAEELVGILRTFNLSALQSLMKINERIAETNMERYRTWSNDHTAEGTHPALFAFRGDVYRGLDVDSLQQDDVVALQRHVRILSGLYGYLRPLDRIHAYRLDMGLKLENAQRRNLYEFWGHRITTALQEDIQDELNEAGRSFVVNLASQEYASAVDLARLDAPVITPVFKERKGDKLRTIGVYTKRARGRMTRFVIQNRIEQPTELQQFDWDGYQYRSELSSETEWWFVRET